LHCLRLVYGGAAEELEDYENKNELAEKER
jgi:hypothetical protein